MLALTFQVETPQDYQKLLLRRRQKTKESGPGDQQQKAQPSFGAKIKYKSPLDVSSVRHDQDLVSRLTPILPEVSAAVGAKAAGSAMLAFDLNTVESHRRTGATSRSAIT